MLPQPECPACCPAPNTPKQPMAARQPQGQGWAAPRPTEPAGAIRAGGTWEVSELFCLHFAQQLFCQAAQPRAVGRAARLVPSSVLQPAGPSPQCVSHTRAAIHTVPQPSSASAASSRTLYWGQTRNSSAFLP